MLAFGFFLLLLDWFLINLCNEFFCVMYRCIKTWMLLYRIISYSLVTILIWPVTSWAVTAVRCLLLMHWRKVSGWLNWTFGLTPTKTTLMFFTEGISLLTFDIVKVKVTKPFLQDSHCTCGVNQMSKSYQSTCLWCFWLSCCCDSWRSSYSWTSVQSCWGGYPQFIQFFWSFHWV